MSRPNKTLWDKRYERGCKMLRSMIEAEVPKIMVQNEARLLLNACHHGPWRAIWALVKHEIVKTWYRRAGFKWEWVRTRVLRRIPDPVMETVDRITEEDKEIERVMKQL